MEIPPRPSPKPDGTEKLLIILSHLSLFLGVGLILPLIVYLVKKGESEKIAAHAREALNFHLSLYFYGIVAFLLCMVLIGIPLLVAVAVMALDFPIIEIGRAHV